MPEPLRLVRIEWKDGRPSTADVMWLRTFCAQVAEAPVQRAVAVLGRWPDVVVAAKVEDIPSIHAEAERRGHASEDYSPSDYDQRLDQELGCAKLAEGQLRVVFKPSFDPEGAVTFQRDAADWRVEVRVARESLWSNRFNPLPPPRLWPSEGRPGVDVFESSTPADVVATVVTAAAVASTQRDRIGIDGMTVRVRSKLRALSCDEDSWGPRKGTRGRLLADFALEIARPVAPDWADRIGRYLD